MYICDREQTMGTNNYAYIYLVTAYKLYPVNVYVSWILLLALFFRVLQNISTVNFVIYIMNRNIINYIHVQTKYS